MIVPLPAIVFYGAVEIDRDSLREHALVPAVLVVVGLPFALILLGWGRTVLFGFPSLIALLFAAVVLPTDPAAVLAVFEDIEAPKRLSVMIGGESLLNDGVGIALVATFLALRREGTETVVGLGTLLSPERIGSIALEIGYVSLGGLVLGLLIGTAGHRLTREIDDRIATVLFTVFVAYGSYLLGEAPGASGVLTVVGLGLQGYRRSRPVTFVGSEGFDCSSAPSNGVAVALPNDQHGDRGTLDHRVRDAPELGPCVRASVTADDDQIRVVVLGVPDDRPGGSPDDGFHRQFDPVLVGQCL